MREHCNSMNKKQEGCDDGTPIVVGLLLGWLVWCRMRKKKSRVFCAVCELFFFVCVRIPLSY